MCASIGSPPGFGHEPKVHASEYRESVLTFLYATPSAHWLISRTGHCHGRTDGQKQVVGELPVAVGVEDGRRRFRYSAMDVWE